MSRLALTLALTNILVVVGSGLATVPPLGAQVIWEDDFDSYPLGSLLAGQGGWISNPGDTTAVSNLQADSPPHSARFLPSSLAAQAIGPLTAGKVQLRTRVYAPLAATGQVRLLTVTEPIPGVIDHWSSELFFDLTSSTLFDFGGLDGGPLDGGSYPLPRNQWLDIEITVDLDANTHEIRFDGQFIRNDHFWTFDPADATFHGLLIQSLGATQLFFDDFAVELLDQDPGYALCFSDGVVPAAGTGTIGLDLVVGATPIAGWSYTAAWDPQEIILADVTPLDPGLVPDFRSTNVVGASVVDSAVIDFVGIETVPIGTYPILTLEFSQGPAPDAATSVIIEDALVLVPPATNTSPTLCYSAIALTGPGAPLTSLIDRGNCNGDSGYDVADAVKTLGVLFGGQTTDCEDACDANDDGLLNIADAVFSLGHLFSGGPAPPGSGQGCSLDVTTGASDTLACTSGC